MVKLVGTDVIYVTRLPSRHLVSVDLVLGTRLPAYCTAPGRTILAHLPSQQVDEILSNTQLVKYTRYTITDPADIRALLQDIRENGFGIQEQEFILGDISAAAPIFDGMGKPVAAINIAVPLSRWNVERLRKDLVPLIMETAQAISKTIAMSANGGQD
ncbi:MAG: IclR family transcriptional regulator C-terminal domain-containing protein [Thermodesulfobacteriota bacterium]